MREADPGYNQYKISLEEQALSSVSAVDTGHYVYGRSTSMGVVERGSLSAIALYGSLSYHNGHDVGIICVLIRYVSGHSRNRLVRLVSPSGSQPRIPQASPAVASATDPQRAGW